jgi:hypothetical protein
VRLGRAPHLPCSRLVARLLRKVAGAVPVAVTVGLTVGAALWAFVVNRLPEPQRSSQATYGAFLVAIIVGLPALGVAGVQIRTAIQQRLGERAASASTTKLTRAEAALESWAPVTKGNLSSALLRLTTTIRPYHPGYASESPGKERPTVTLAIALAALPPRTDPPTVALDDMLTGIVTAPETAAWIESLTADVLGSGWRPGMAGGSAASAASWSTTAQQNSVSRGRLRGRG